MSLSCPNQVCPHLPTVARFVVGLNCACAQHFVTVRDQFPCVGEDMPAPCRGPKLVLLDGAFAIPLTSLPSVLLCFVDAGAQRADGFRC